MKKHIWEEAEMMFLHPNAKNPDSLQHYLLTGKSLEITKMFEIPIQWIILPP